jgi:hypothetical protein
VNDLISKAAENEAGHQEAMVPLIRVRVDYTGFTTINPQRFGQKFVGKVCSLFLFPISSPSLSCLCLNQLKVNWLLSCGQFPF